MISQVEFLEEDIVERIDLDDEIVLLFNFYEEKEDVICAMDSDLNGELGNFEYTGDEDLVAFRIENEEDIKWPVIIKYYSVD